MAARTVAISILGLVACATDPPSAKVDAPASVVIDAGFALSALLPGHAGPNLGGLAGRYLADVESCGACHPDAFEQQQASVHALASFNNPIYRMAVERLRESKGKAAGDVCAGCHDAALLVDGAMNEEVVASDFRAHNGVSCRLCHGIIKAGRDGNGSFTLDPVPLPIPRTGDAASLKRHKSAVAPPPISELCGSCHQSFLSPASGNAVVLGGQNEMRVWADSAYAGQGIARIDSVAKQDCVSCHMPKVPAPLGDVVAEKSGMISSHRVLGGHTWMAAMRGDQEQLEALEKFLASAATIDVVTRSQEGQHVVFDVVIRNEGVGHHFPGGVRDAANTRVRVLVTDKHGRVLLRSEDGAEAHVLRALVADADGELMGDRQTHRYAALIADHTIAPRDVAVVRYRGQLPACATHLEDWCGPPANSTDGAKHPRSTQQGALKTDGNSFGTSFLEDWCGPPATSTDGAKHPRSAQQGALKTDANSFGTSFLNVKVELVHQSRSAELAHATCAEARTRRGRFFARYSSKFGAGSANGCAAQPERVIATATRAVGDTGSKSFERMYEHGLGLLHEMQERALDAEPSLSTALTLAQTDMQRAMALLALGQLSGRLGRIDEAVERMTRAQALVPSNAAIAASRGRALARVWRHQEASEAFAVAIQLAPENMSLWRDYAIALGASGQQNKVLNASQQGLRLAPRDPDLLRVQALALRRQDAPAAKAAMQSYLEHRGPDNRGAIIRSCTESSSLCAREALPVHEHRLVGKGH